ncbi:MAG: hypothetical protein NVSMB9_04610 [Isosphaeraceae bacterium]
MTPTFRVLLCTGILGVALSAQATLEGITSIQRPLLRAPLASLPLVMGPWVGRDVPVDPEVLKKSQADQYLNRVYEDQGHPGRRLWLWLNYSRKGDNLRHSPVVCLPSGGWTKVESQCKVVSVPNGQGGDFPIMSLAYTQGELVQSIGFWYYIFGEGRLEQYVRSLPITSRSSHGRTTRGSGLTVEVFCPGSTDPDGDALRDFSSRLVVSLAPSLPDAWACYYLP